MTSGPEVVTDRVALLDHLELKGKACAEIGVCHGEYSIEILRRSPQILHLVDAWSCEGRSIYGRHTVRNGMGHTGYLAVSLRFRGNPSVNIIHRTSLEAALDFPDGELDFVYIDADHSLPFVYADLFLWYPKVKRGGWIAGHDFNHTNKAFKVDEAVQMFTMVTGEKLSIVTGEKCNDGPIASSFAIKKTR